MAKGMHKGPRTHNKSVRIEPKLQTIDGETKTVRTLIAPAREGRAPAKTSNLEKRQAAFATINQQSLKQVMHRPGSNKK